MPNYTQHFNLIKPKKTENYDIEDVTTKNMDILDEELFGKEDKVPGKGLSTNDFTDAYKNKLDELKNYDDTEIKNNLNEQVQKNNLQEQEIEELQGKITNLKEENTQLKNQIPTGEVEGEYINIKDSSNLELVDFNVEGKTEQETREGYNILDTFKATTTSSSGVTRTITEDGKLIFNGTATNFANFWIANLNEILEPGEYTVKTNLDLTNKGIYAIKSSETEDITTFRTTKTFSIAEETPLDRMIIQLNSGTVWDNTEVELMIYKGTDDKPYQQYGIRPSINYPSKVRGCGDNINLFNEDTAINGYLNTETGAVIDYELSKTSDFIDIEGKKELTLSYEYDTLNSTNQKKYVFYDADKEVIASGGYYPGTKTNGISIIENAKYLKFTYDANCYDVKLEKGSIATPYSSYGMGSISVIKNNGNLAKIREDNFELTENNTIKSTKRANNIRVNDSIKIKAGQNVKARFKLLSKPSTATSFTCNKSDLTFASFNNFNLNQNYNRTWTATEDCEIYYTAWGDANNETFEFQLSVSIDEAIDYIKHEDKEYIIQTQEPFYEGDTFVKVDGVRNEYHNWNKLILTGTENNWATYTANGVTQFLNKSLIKMLNQEGRCTHFKATDVAPLYTKEEIGSIYMYKSLVGFGILLDANDFPTLESFTTMLEELYNAGTPVTIWYKPENPKLLPCTEEQNAVLDAIEADGTYKNVTYIYSNDEIEPKIKLQYYKDLETLINRAGGQ